MSQTMLIKLKEGLQLKNPRDNMLMKSGETYYVPMNQFWLRRLHDGDCFLAESGEIPAPKSDMSKPKNKKGE